MHGAKYGEVVPWEQGAAHRWDIVGFPRGILILEAQGQLMKVLRGMAETLVDGLGDDLVSDLSLNHRPGPKQLNTADLRTYCVNETFASSPNFDMTALASAAQARLSLAGDHVYELQTDPAYMRRYVNLIFEGELSKEPEAEAYGVVAMDIDFDVWTARHWSWVVQEVNDLQDIRSRYLDYINPGEPLPQKYNEKLGAIEAVLADLLDIQSRHIQGVLPQRPGFRHLYNFDYSERGAINITLKQTNPDHFAGDAERFVQDRLEWCIAALTTNPDAQSTLDHSRLLELLDHLIKDPLQNFKKRIDETLYRKLSDLAAFNDLLTMVRSHRPRLMKRTLEDIKKTERGRGWRYVGNKYNGDAFSGLEKWTYENRNLQECPLNWCKLGQFLVSFMEKPEPTDTSNRSWILLDSAQRRALGEFWENARSQHKRKLKAFAFRSEDIEYDLKEMSADSQPEHLEALRAERQEIIALMPKPTGPQPSRVKVQKPKRTPKSQSGLVEPAAAPPTAPKNVNVTKSKANINPDTSIPLQTQWGATTEEYNPSTKRKPKVKTHSDDTSLECNLEALNIAPSVSAPVQPIAAVKKGTLETLRSLFPARERATEIAWDKFADAMAKVGFIARRNGGSAFLFEPSGESKWFGQGKISIHRPHPGSTIDSVMLLYIGKRMKKWFGWNKESFELEKK